MGIDRELIWTTEAKDMLMRIFDGLAGCVPRIATSVVRGIYTQTQVLLKSPEIGWHFGGIPERDVRVLLYGHYRIAYEIHKIGYIVICGVDIVPCWSEPAVFETTLQQRTHFGESTSMTVFL